MFGLFAIMVLSGLTLLLNPLLWVFVFLFPGPIPGNSSRTETRWWNLEVPCRKCPRLVTFSSGIICANYGHQRDRYLPCNSAYCAECFTAHKYDTFEVKIPRDFDGVSLAELEDEVRYQQARPGDHLSLPFQCPNCQSQNIRCRDLHEGSADDDAFECLAIRATLDAFWSRSSATIAKHVREVKFMIKFGATLGFPPLPPLGPWPIYEHMGMKEAIFVLMRSMEPGRGGGKVKYSTARGIRGAATVIWRSSPDSQSDLVFSSASARGRFIATKCPSESWWYSRFSSGINARMGDVVDQDRAYTLEVILALLEMYELEWEKDGLGMPLNSMYSCMFLLVSCLGGMRGYEVVWTDLAALRYDLNYMESRGDKSAIAWPIVGRFKARNGVLDCFVVPIAGTTKSGIKFYEWTQRFVSRLEEEGYTDGWAFKRPDGSRAKASDYRNNIFRKLVELQDTTSLIEDECNVWDAFGVQRSGRRAFVVICTNAGISKHIIELQCRWSTDRANGVRTVVRTMIHVYSEVRNMLESLIRPSKSF